MGGVNCPNQTPSEATEQPNIFFLLLLILIEDFYPLLAKEYYKKAKKRNVDLDSRDFIKSNLKQIEKDLIIQTAIHEAKHKVDELEKPNQRLSIDNEISAHLTAAIFSSCPFNGLNSAIGRMEGFQRNVNSWALNDITIERYEIADLESILHNFDK